MSSRDLVNPKVVIQLSCQVRNTLDDETEITQALLANINDRLTSGVGPSMANRGWQWKNVTSSPKTIASGAVQVIDLYDYETLDMGAGSGADGVGQALAVEAIVAILIKNENAVGEAGSLEIEPNSTYGWTPIGSHTVATGGALRGGGALLKYQPDATGFDVVDETTCRIKLTANGAAVNYSVWVLGRHDDETSSSSQSSSSSSSMTSSVSASSQSSSSSSSGSSSSGTSSESSSSGTSSSSQSSSSSSSGTSSESSSSP